MGGILRKVPKKKSPQNWPIELTESLTKMTVSCWANAKEAVKFEINSYQKLIIYALEDAARSVQGSLDSITSIGLY